MKFFEVFTIFDELKVSDGEPSLLSKIIQQDGFAIIQQDGSFILPNDGVSESTIPSATLSNTNNSGLTALLLSGSL